VVTLPVGATPNRCKVSPQGDKVAFERKDDSHVWVVNIDGSGLHQLAASPNGEAHPAWSPDGKFVALVVADCTPQPINPVNCGSNLRVLPSDANNVDLLKDRTGTVIDSLTGFAAHATGDITWR
jgi:Tol biopolymer transport system component